MNKFLIVIFLVFSLFLPLLHAESVGAETILLNRLSKLPEVLVSYGKKTITKNDALKQKNPPSETAGYNQNGGEEEI